MMVIMYDGKHGNSYRVVVHFDKQSNSYWAHSPDLDGLVVSGDCWQHLLDEITIAIDELTSKQLHH